MSEMLQAFATAIRADPSDTQLLIFADWLEEQDDKRCEGIRWLVENCWRPFVWDHNPLGAAAYLSAFLREAEDYVNDRLAFARKFEARRLVCAVFDDDKLDSKATLETVRRILKHYDAHASH